jgi:hypothetical protein
MANARRRRAQRTDDDYFDILLTDALPQLLNANQITPGATWAFYVEGDNLVIVRSVATRDNSPPQT